MKQTLGVGAVLLAVAAALVVLGVFSVQRLTPDAPSAEDADLRPAASTAGPDDAYADFVKMTAALKLSPAERELVGKQAESQAPDMAAMQPLIARNTEVLSHFAAFSRRTRFTDANYGDPDKVSFETPVLQFFPLVSAARLSSLRAAALLEQGRAPAALEEALMIMDAGQVMLRSDQPIIAALVGLLVSDIGARRAREVIVRGTLDKAGLSDASRRLSASQGGVAALQAGLRFEYLTQAHMIDHLAETAAKHPEARWYWGLAARSLYFYQPVRTRALYAARFRGLVAEAAKPCAAAKFVDVPVPVDARPNVLGRVFYNMAFPQYDKLYVRRCESGFRIAAALSASALAAYRRDHRRWPAALKDLVPGYLASVPVDPFTGAALLYAPDTGEVHSAGKDVDGKAL